MSSGVERPGNIPASEKSLDHAPDIDAELNKAKIMGDLAQGFRVSFLRGGSVESYVTAIARNGDDLFEVYADGSQLSTHDPSRDFTRFDCEVRRRKLLPPQPGSATLELWKISSSTRQTEEEKFQARTDNGGELTEEAFWERYHGSEVDHDLTAEHLANEAKRERERVRRIQGMEIRINWIVDEREEAEYDALSSETDQQLPESL